MKTIKGIAIFIFFSLLFGSCFSPPEFSIVPSITYNDVYFREGKETFDADTLAVLINFQDGDGDLGLTETQTDEPYHPVNYYLENNGDTIPIATYSPYTNLQAFVKVPDGVTGKLITVRTRDNPLYSSFPPFECPDKATSYQYTTIYVDESDTAIFSPSKHHVDSIIRGGADFPDVYILYDTFYYKPNPTHFNIEVQFLIQQNNNTFVEFDWKNELCASLDMSGRFPVLTDSQNPLEGTLKYSMTSTGFNPLFKGKIMKLKVRIRDRALNRSNYAETKLFTLDDIRK